MQKRSFNNKYVVDELNKLSLKVSTQMSLFVIGGLALIHFGLKEATKDIDIVVQSKDEFNDLTHSLISLGYSSPSPLEITTPYRKMGASKILENKDGFRWDIFHQQVCRALIFSGNMASRAADFYVKSPLKVKLASKEDVFLFKGITEREADLDDMRLLAESGLDWNIIKQECHYQSDFSGRLWENALLENLSELREKYRIRTPIEKTLEKTVEEKLSEDAITQAIKRGIVTTRTIAQTTKLPEHIVRKYANTMHEKRLLRIDKSNRPHKFELVAD
jgi:hypothetical protein